MPRNLTSIGVLGNADPETRSALRKLARTVRSLTVAMRGQPLPNESEVVRSAGLIDGVGFNSRGKIGSVAFGFDVDKPTTQFLATRGTGSFLYIARDTNKVYMWTGTAYKSATFT